MLRQAEASDEQTAPVGFVPPPLPQGPPPLPPVREPRRVPWRELFAHRRAPWFASSFTSALVHASLFILLALGARAIEKPLRELGPRYFLAEPSAELDGSATVEPAGEGSTVGEIKNDAPAIASLPAPLLTPNTLPVPTTGLGNDDGPAPANTLGLPEGGDLAAPIGGGSGGGLEGRSGPQRAALVKSGGGTPASERAVEAGLRWLALHQRSDGSWRFDHQTDACHGECHNPGKFASTTAATGLALLPFLGAGHTHASGEYAEVVRRGIYYLGNRMSLSSSGGDLQEGSMYSQGLATIALCEAYAMTHDEDLRPYAQKAVDFIVTAQHADGGWRYTPGQPGDVTVTGWQLMALKSARLGRLNVFSPAIYRVEHFLDTVQLDGGAAYGYLGPAENTPTTTAIGLLCRMYTGWERNNPALRRGVQTLLKHGPDKSDMYFNYYATQVLHHMGGPDWYRWNNVMRDYLIKTQSTAGHAAGSWYFDHKHGPVGGRLYCTATAVMTLEVYYRYMPIYAPEAFHGF